MPKDSSDDAVCANDRLLTESAVSGASDSRATHYLSEQGVESVARFDLSALRSR